MKSIQGSPLDRGSEEDDDSSSMAECDEGSIKSFDYTCPSNFRSNNLNIVGFKCLNFFKK